MFSTHFKYDFFPLQIIRKMETPIKRENLSRQIIKGEKHMVNNHLKMFKLLKQRGTICDRQIIKNENFIANEAVREGVSHTFLEKVTVSKCLGRLLDLYIKKF